MAAAKTAATAAKPVQSQKAPGSPSAGAGAAAAKSPADKPKAPAAAAAGAGAAGAAAAGTVALAQSTTGGVKIQLSAAAAAPQTAAPPAIDSIAQDHIFSKQELKRLFRRFKKLDTDKSGTLSVPEFLAIPELEHNPLVRRVVATFDTDKSGEVDFQEFISALSVFAQTDGKDQKFKFTFKMYDVDGDSFISNADLFHVLKAMVGNNLNDTQLQQLVDRTILQGDKDKDGKLSYSEFLDMVKDTDLDEKLKIEL